MVELIKDGISIENDKVILNTDSDLDNDIMNIIYPDIYKSDFGGNTYYFGYRFNDSANRKDRTTLIHWLKGIGDDIIDDSSLRKFIRKPLIKLNKEENLSTFDAILYPRSNRSNLTHIIINEVGKLCQHDTYKGSFELVKTLPANVEFDWNLFDFNYIGEIGDNQYKQIYNYVENTLMPKIHNLTYFSIADNVKPKYRQYIQNYLTIKDISSAKILKSIQNGKILIVDDINTSGSTLTEILRIVHNINNNCEIYIFTLIGKE
jgi:hypothetical protein